MMQDNNEIRTLSFEELDVVAGGYSVAEFKADATSALSNFVKGFFEGDKGAQTVMKTVLA